METLTTTQANALNLIARDADTSDPDPFGDVFVNLSSGGYSADAVAYSVAHRTARALVKKGLAKMIERQGIEVGVAITDAGRKAAL